MHVILTANYSPWSPYSGGGQRSAHNLAKALCRRGHDVEVVFTKPPWERVDAPPDLPYRLHWAALPAMRSRRTAPLRPLATLSVAWTVRRLVRPGQTVVHCQGEEGALLPRLGAPLVATPRYPRYPPALTEGTGGVLGKARLFFTAPKFLLLGAALRGASRCCLTSRHAARQVRRAYPGAAPIQVVPNGVTEAFLHVRRVPQAERGPLVFFGRLDRAKGVDTLFDAFAQLENEPGSLPPLHIAGRGPEEEALAAKARALEDALEDRVHLRGWMRPEALAALVARAAVAVLPSREESFGNAMAETMAAGTPVVSTKAGSVPEVVGDGETGLLVEPGNPEALAAAVRRLLDAPEEAERMGRAGRRYVRQHLTWEAAAEQFEVVYQSLRPGAT